MLTICVLVVLAILSSSAARAGSGWFMFSDWAGPKLRVWTYVPTNVDADSRIVFIMHGANRDPERYRDDWVPHAKQHNLILVAPEFTKKNFRGSRNYNLGRMYKKDGTLNPRDVWSYTAIEAIFDAVKQRTGSRQATYDMYGHSAGGQFVHRYLYFVPEARISLAIAANPGWYTLPNFDATFPYGLKESLADGDDLRRALGAQLVVLLGTADNDPNGKQLRRTPEAMEQGAHRYARGQFFVRMGMAQAKQLQTPFGWRLFYAKDVGHKNRQMSAYAAAVVKMSLAESSENDQAAGELIPPN